MGIGIRSRYTYYDPRPNSIFVMDTYKANREYIDTYMRDHLIRDCGGFYTAVWTALVYEQLYRVHSPNETLPFIYRLLLSNLKQPRSLFQCNLVIGYRQGVKPTYVFAYLRDREVGLAR